MSKSKKSLMKTKLALAIAVALGCSLMSVASAATYDMTSSEYAGGITLDSKTYPNRAQVGSSKVKPDVFSFRYDKNTGKIVGGDVNVTSDVMSKPVFASLEVKASDLPENDKRYAESLIEIQVASALMLTWAEVEHDLVYKPFSGELSYEECQILDELNGLVLAGEIALQRLQKECQFEKNCERKYIMISETIF